MQYKSALRNVYVCISEKKKNYSYIKSTITDNIKELIVQSASSIEIRKKALEEGYRPLAIDGINKVLKGMTTLEELNNKILMY